jgi:alternate signal-mediated exported protein
MNRSTKGALAASAAGALLLGGAGSLAYWNSNQTVGGAAIASGTLTLTQEGAQTCTDWTLDAAGATTYVPGTTLVVPGDVITRTCDYTVTASGEHLSATLGITPPAYQAGHDADLEGALTLAATYTLNGVPVADGQAISTADDTAVLHAVVTVTFKSTTLGVTAQGMSTVLDDITVGLTQAHA